MIIRLIDKVTKVEKASEPAHDLTYQTLAWALKPKLVNWSPALPYKIIDMSKYNSSKLATSN